MRSLQEVSVKMLLPDKSAWAMGILDDILTFAVRPIPILGESTLTSPH